MTKGIVERKVNESGKLIMILNDYELKNVEELSLEMNDALFINFDDLDKIEKVIIKIRTSDQKSVYLMPVFIAESPKRYSDVINDLVDGVFNNINDDKLNSLINAISASVSQLKELHEDKYERKVLYKLLRYMYTRTYELKPYIDVSSTLGYIFPFLDIHYIGDIFKDKFEYQILEEGEKAGLIKSKFIDKIHICPQCGSGFHNFKELCVKCGSANLTDEYLIHHFVCANVGPERDYKKGNLLICPKCNRELRHIGVDYDRPSMIFECNNCGASFQDPNIEAFCFNCNLQSSVADLLPKDIKSFTITKYGLGLVKSSLFHEGYTESKFPGCYSYNVFRELLGQEVHRVKMINQRSSCGAIFVDLKEGEKDMDMERKERIFFLLAEVFSASSLSLCHFEDIFTFLLPYKDNIKESKEFIEELLDNGRTVLEENVEGVQIELRFEIFDIKIDDIEDELLNRLIINA